VKSLFPLPSFCIVLLIGIASAQTYDVGGQSTSSPSSNQNAPAASSSQEHPNLGWGSSIEVARESRAAQDALKRSDYAAAVSHAERAAKAAPQNAELWFLLGYAARLDGRYQASIDAYNRGLQRQPNSTRGLAGMAQTYAKMGRDEEASQLLRKVLAANPKDANSLQLAGELMLSSDPKAALILLQRAEAVAPTAHGDLLIAHAYERLGQPDA